MKHTQLFKTVGVDRKHLNLELNNIQENYKQRTTVHGTKSN